MSRQSFTTIAAVDNCSSNKKAVVAVGIYLFSTCSQSFQDLLSDLSIFGNDDFQHILMFAPLLVTDAYYLFALLPDTSVGLNYKK